LARSKIDNVVDDIVKLLEYAKGFPQEHLMSAGQLLQNRRTQNSPTGGGSTLRLDAAQIAMALIDLDLGNF